MSNLKDQLISFETAKLATEKGFNCDIGLGYKPFGNYYSHEGILNGDVTQYIVTPVLEFKPTPAPTQSLLQRWLREVCRINVIVKVYTSGYYRYSIYIFDNIQWLNASAFLTPSYSSYEEALENGLYFALGQL